MSSRCFPPGRARRVLLSDDALALVARRFAVLAEPMRLRLIQALFAGEKPVHALVEETGGTQANISRHLQTLTQANVLSRRKAGRQVFYAIAASSAVRLRSSANAATVIPRPRSPSSSPRSLRIWSRI